MPSPTGYIVTVRFLIKPEFRVAFLEAALENAEVSRTREVGCSAFEVAESCEGKDVFLYEVYSDEAAFKVHVATSHFRHFDTIVAPWTINKEVAAYRRLSP